MSSMLAAVVQLNSAFYKATTAYMHTREAIIQATPVSSGVIGPNVTWSAPVAASQEEAVPSGIIVSEKF